MKPIRIPLAIATAAMSAALLGAHVLDRPVRAAELTTSPSSSSLDATSSASDSASSLRYRDVVIPAGTVLSVTVDTSVGTDYSRVEDTVRGHLRRPVVIRGVTTIPAGSTLLGHVSFVDRPGRVHGRGRIAVRFTQVTVRSGNRVPISSSSIARLAPATKSEDAQKIGFPAAGGAIIGALAGGKKGAAIGAAAGGGAGTAVVLSTRGKDARIGRGATATVRLLKPIVVRIPVAS